jgi:glycosyltransferase involved in cell wall biosynthesis
MDWRAKTVGLFHRQAFALRLAAHRRRWPEATPMPVPQGRFVRVTGFFSETLGIGSAGDLTCNALTAAGYEVVTEDIRPLQRKLLTRRPGGFGDGREVSVWIIHANPPEARMALFARAPEAWRDLYRIGYWTWESSLAPRDWLDVACWFHEIWVPSPFVRDALADAFAASPFADQAGKLRVMPHPVPASEAGHRHGEAFKALTLLDPRSDPERKNPQGAILAWLKAFPEPGPAQLIVKTLPVAGSDPLLNEMQALIRGRNDITFVDQALSRADLDALVAGCDVLLSLHRAEGFGLALAEAMAMGLVVVATGWSGNMAFMTPENAVPIPFRLVAANRRHNGPVAQWAEPGIEAAAASLRQLASSSVLRQRLGDAAARDIEALVRSWHTALAG